jgi:23S rRNA U2552 (ribose-2'-O)-methylase RlmE/FtsJ
MQFKYQTDADFRKIHIARILASRQRKAEMQRVAGATA